MNEFKKVKAPAKDTTIKGDEELVSPLDVNPKTTKADRTVGDAGVKTPWESSHQTTVPNAPGWQTHHQNSQGLKGHTTWEHKGAKRGDKDGPQQRVNPYNVVVNLD